MSTPRDDDALSWDGDDDPTLDVGERTASAPAPAATAPEPATRSVAPAPETAARSVAPVPEPDEPAEGASPAADDPGDDDPTSAPLGNAGLIGIGMVAATFLLFAIGWALAGRQLLGLGIPIPEVTVVAMTIGAALAPPVWFVAGLVLTRGWRTWQRFLVLILGVVLLVPWPLLSMGAFG